MFLHATHTLFGSWPTLLERKPNINIRISDKMFSSPTFGLAFYIPNSSGIWIEKGDLAIWLRRQVCFPQLSQGQCRASCFCSCVCHVLRAIRLKYWQRSLISTPIHIINHGWFPFPNFWNEGFCWGTIRRSFDFVNCYENRGYFFVVVVEPMIWEIFQCEWVWQILKIVLFVRITQTQTVRFWWMRELWLRGLRDVC